MSVLETDKPVVIDGETVELDWGRVEAQQWTDAPAPSAPLTPLSALTVVRAQMDEYPETPIRDLVTRLLGATERALAEITSSADLKDFHAGMRGIEVLLQGRGAELAEANLLSASRLRVERKIGALLKETVSPGRGNARLPDNVSFDQSSRWQRIAEIPDGNFEYWLQEQISLEQEITTSGALALWHLLQPNPPPMTDDEGRNGDVPPPDDTDYSDEILYVCPGCGAVHKLSEMKVYRAEEG